MNYYIESKIYASNTSKNEEAFSMSYNDAKIIAEKYINKNYKLYTYNEDLVSNLITAIWVAHKKFDKNKGKSFKNYILDHCKWTILDFNKKNTCRKFSRNMSEKGYIHSEFTDLDNKETIARLLDKTILTTKELEAITLKYYNGLSAKEIALKMKVTRSYVNKLLKDALLELRLSANRLKHTR